MISSFFCEPLTLALSLSIESIMQFILKVFMQFDFGEVLTLFVAVGSLRYAVRSSKQSDKLNVHIAALSAKLAQAQMALYKIGNMTDKEARGKQDVLYKKLIGDIEKIDGWIDKKYPLET